MVEQIPLDSGHKRYRVYRILGIILNGLALFFLLDILFSFGAVGFQPSMLLVLFIVICMLIYTNLSIVFGRLVLRNGQDIAPKVRDWLRVNSIICFGGTSLMALVLLVSLLNTKFFKSFAAQKKVDLVYVEYAFFFLLFTSLLFVIHVLMTWYYLRKYRDHFKEPPAQT